MKIVKLTGPNDHTYYVNLDLLQVMMRGKDETKLFFSDDEEWTAMETPEQILCICGHGQPGSYAPGASTPNPPTSSPDTAAVSASRPK